MSESKLFTPLKVGAVTAPNRVFMAPLTRLRSIEPGDIPTPLMGEYYRQRASSGLIISEATQISAQAKGYAGAPGLHSPEQIAAWKKITAGGNRNNAAMTTGINTKADIRRYFSKSDPHQAVSSPGSVPPKRRSRLAKAFNAPSKSCSSKSGQRTSVK